LADQEAGSGQAGFAPEPPRSGCLEATIDDKGRLRIPAQYVKYINSLGDTTVFSACADGETGRVYPMKVWRENETRLSERPASAEEAAAREEFEWVVRATGGESEIDGNGRISLPPKVREVLGITPKSSVHMMFVDGAFDLLTDVVMQRTLSARLAAMAQKRPVLKASGIR
jgi:DNA-binding transcriptional regulator/RsmH inhibitor MraZ